jgi:CPA2 family monovalent cation:H+ antiporter-2
MQDSPLIATIVGAIVLAFLFGSIAQRLKVSPLVGYLLAGVAVGPFTPGYVANQALASELAEIGVILLMFGVGLKFSLKDLLSVGAVAIPGSLAKIALATVLGTALGLAMGWTVMASVIFGLALSVASTVVLLRTIEDRDLVATERGRIAVGWLIVEDLVMVLALVLLPALVGAETHSGVEAVIGTLVFTLAKAAAFFILMLALGRRIVPSILHFAAHSGSREIFRLAVLAIALGTAYGAAKVFGVSFALGAFFAGIVLAGSSLSQQAGRDMLPLRDAFGVLFFVSVGMLVDPRTLLAHPWPALGTLAVIMVGKSAVAFAIMRLSGQPVQVAAFISASLAQIGEFSFILAGLGLSLGVLPHEARDLILAGAIVSIVLNPLLFLLLSRWEAKAAPAAAEPQSKGPVEPGLEG